jgi:hypothetical protein
VKHDKQKTTTTPGRATPAAPDAGKYLEKQDGVHAIKRASVSLLLRIIYTVLLLSLTLHSSNWGVI